MLTRINAVKFIQTALITFSFVYLFNWLFHGMLLQDLYNQTPELWRSAEDMRQHISGLALQQALLSIALVLLFIGGPSTGYEDLGIREGARFGLALGLVLGLMEFGHYFSLPISMNLAFAWLLGYIVMGLAVGVIAAFVYERPVLK